MNVDAVGFLPPLGNIQAAPVPSAPTAMQAGGFGDWFTSQMAQVNHQLLAANTGLQDLAVGNTNNLHQVMINLEEAKLSFQLLVQVRNNLLQAYQDVMRMQV